jgi:hypothetical protein
VSVCLSVCHILTYIFCTIKLVRKLPVNCLYTGCAGAKAPLLLALELNAMMEESLVDNGASENATSYVPGSMFRIVLFLNISKTQFKTFSADFRDTQIRALKKSCNQSVYPCENRKSVITQVTKKEHRAEPTIRKR